MARTILYLPDVARIVQIIDVMTSAKSAAMAILDYIRNENPHIDITDKMATAPAPIDLSDTFRPTPTDPTYGQLREALRPFADAGRNCSIEHARVYRKDPNHRKEQIMSMEFDGPGLKPFVDAAWLLYGSPPETPPMPGT